MGHTVELAVGPDMTADAHGNPGVPVDVARFLGRGEQKREA